MTDYLESESNAEAGAPNPKRLLLLAAVIALFAVPAYLRHRQNVSADALLVTMQRDESKAAELSKIEAREAERDAAAQSLANEIAISKALAEAALLDVTAANEAITELAEAKRSWEKVISDLLESDQGRAIGANPETTNQVVAIIDVAEDASSTSAERLTKKLESLGKPIRLAAENPTPGFQINSALAEQIESIAVDANQRTETLDNSLNELASLVAIAGDSPAEEAPTLAAVLTDRKAAEREGKIQAEQKRLAALQAALDAKALREKEKNAKEIAEAKMLTDRFDAEAEKQRLKVEGDRVAAEKKRLAEQAKRDAAKAKLNAEFDKALPEIKQYLSGYTKSGHALRGTNGGIEPGPVSYDKLVSMGATEPTDKGLKAVITSMNPNINNRSTFNWHLNSRMTHQIWWNSTDMSVPRKVHSLLVKYGAIMVERGMLAE